MDVITVVCTVLCALCAVKPWRAWPRLKDRIRRRRADNDLIDYEPDDPLERFASSRASAAIFKSALGEAGPQ